MLTSDLLKNASDEEILEHIKVGGHDFVWEKERFSGRTSLHVACSNNASIKVVKELIEVGGGRDFVWEKEDRNGWTALHVACENNASIDVVKMLIKEGGGRDIVWEADKVGRTPLHFVCLKNAPVDVVKELIEAGGGRDIVWEKDEDDSTALHLACYFNASIDGVKVLIEYGGGDIITQINNWNETPLQVLITDYWSRDEERKRAGIEKASFLINKGIELQIGGEYSIGGIFNNNTNEEEVRDGIYKYWDDRVLPTLEQVMAQPHNRHLPILQALIVNKAPPRVIKSAINTFTDSINTRDSFDKYPIDVAVEHGLSWDDGMEKIVGAFALAQQTTPLNVCIKHGVQWENGTKIVLENDDNVDILEIADTSTALYPFMAAAVGHSNTMYDIDSIFHLIKLRPLLVKQFSAEK